MTVFCSAEQFQHGLHLPDSHKSPKMSSKLPILRTSSGKNQFKENQICYSTRRLKAHSKFPNNKSLKLFVNMIISRNVVFAMMLLIVAFAPSKLLAFYEDDNIRLAVGDWILMIWCIFASLLLQGIWTSVLAHVTEVAAGTGDSLLFGDAEHEERLRQEEAEKAAEQRETFQLLFRLLGYMGRQWKYYGMAFFFLFCYSLSKFSIQKLKSFKSHHTFLSS